MMRLQYILFTLIAVVALSGCFKDEDYDTQIIIRPSVQDVSGGDFVPYVGCVAYAFDADTTVWEVRSWADAVSGVMRSKEGEKELLPFSSSVSYDEDELEEGSMLSLKVSKPSALILVASTIDETYAYRIYHLGMNISKTYVYTSFRSWKDVDYTENNWEYIVPETETDL